VVAVVVRQHDRAHGVERAVELRECGWKLVVVAGEAAIDHGDGLVDYQVSADPVRAEPVNAVANQFAPDHRLPQLYLGLSNAYLCRHIRRKVPPAASTTASGVKQQHVTKRHADRQPCICGGTGILEAGAASLATRGDRDSRTVVEPRHAWGRRSLDARLLSGWGALGRRPLASVSCFG
jgi:hypothetical protein